MEKIIFDKFSCTVSRGDHKKKIGSKDALVLEFLFISGVEGAAKSDILAYAWQGIVVTDASLSRSISSLRAALSELSPNEDIIITIPRIGYKIDQDKIYLHSPTESQQYIIEKIESKTTPEVTTETAKSKRDLKIPNSIKVATKAILSIASIALVIIYSRIFFAAQDYKNSEYISPNIVKEALADNRSILFLNADNKDYFKEKIAKINCKCIFIASDNEQYHFIAAYLLDEGKSIGFAFKKNESVDIINFIQTKLDDGVHHD